MAKLYFLPLYEEVYKPTANITTILQNIKKLLLKKLPFQFLAMEQEFN
ncbi:MAG: hypothetical protein IKL86_04580 [Clostridia bacterium]|nr:hypothetical protein [Clostridia bacterium]